MNALRGYARRYRRVAAVIAAALVVLARAGYLRAARAGLFRWGTPPISAILALSALANGASTSPWEHPLLAPLTALMALACLTVALGSSEPFA